MLYAKVYFFFNEMGEKTTRKRAINMPFDEYKAYFFYVDYFLISAINRHCEYSRIITNTQSGHVFHWHEFCILNTPKVNS